PVVGERTDDLVHRVAAAQARCHYEYPVKSELLGLRAEEFPCTRPEHSPRERMELLDGKWLEKVFYLHLCLSPYGLSAMRSSLGDSSDIKPWYRAGEYPRRRTGHMAGRNRQLGQPLPTRSGRTRKRRSGRSSTSHPPSAECTARNQLGASALAA